MNLIIECQMKSKICLHKNKKKIVGKYLTRKMSMTQNRKYYLKIFSNVARNNFFSRFLPEEFSFLLPNRCWPPTGSLPLVDKWSLAERNFSVEMLWPHLALNLFISSASYVCWLCYISILSFSNSIPSAIAFNGTHFLSTRQIFLNV